LAVYAKRERGKQAAALILLLALWAGAAVAWDGAIEFPRPADPPAFVMTEIRDSMMGNAVAARVALPRGWSVKEQRVEWNFFLYADPARVVFRLRDSENEAGFAFVSRMPFLFDEGLVAKLSELLGAAYRNGVASCLSTAGDECARLLPALEHDYSRLVDALYNGERIEGGAVFMRPKRADQFARWVVGRDRKITDVREADVARPEALAALWGEAAAEAGAAVRRDWENRDPRPPCLAYTGTEHDLALLPITRFARDGKDFEGAVLAPVQNHVFSDRCFKRPQPSLDRCSGDGCSAAPPPFAAHRWQAGPLLIASARQGRLRAHAAELALIAASIEVDPVWEAVTDDMVRWLDAKQAEALTMHCVRPCFPPDPRDAGRVVREFFDKRSRAPRPPEIPAGRRAFMEALGRGWLPQE
jgi:hypothetical protein